MTRQRRPIAMHVMMMMMMGSKSATACRLYTQVLLEKTLQEQRPVTP